MTWKLGMPHNVWIVGVLVGIICHGSVVRAEPPPAAVEHVYLTSEQAMHQAFPAAASVTRETRSLSPAVRQQIARRIGFRLRDSVATVLIARSASGVLGYGMQGEEKGKYYPITFFVATDPACSVRQVTVLVYRESRGDAVRRDQFLSQFRGKTPRDALAIDRDLVHVSGATMSSWAMAAGVRRVVATLAALYGAAPPGVQSRSPASPAHAR